MRNRYLALTARITLCTVVASLILLPAAGFAADKPTSIVGNEKSTGFGPRLADSDSDAIKRPTMFDRVNYTWPFASGPTYGAPTVRFKSAKSPGLLYTRVGTLDLSAGLQAFPEELSTAVKLDQLPAQYFVLQFHPDALNDGSAAAVLENIEAVGGQSVGQMPVAAYAVRLNAAAYAAAQGQPGVMALMPYQPALKLNPLIGRVPLLEAARAVSEIYKLDVRLFAGEDANVMAQAIANLGATVIATTGDTVRIELHRNKLGELARLEGIEMVFEVTPTLVYAEETTTAMMTGFYNGGATPYHDAGVDGSGGGVAGVSAQLLIVVDTGIQMDAGDLSHTRTNAGFTSPGAGATHRKVEFMGITSVPGTGDDQGCDATTSGGFTHGHTVSTTALGNGSGDVILSGGPAYGAPWEAIDLDLNPWKLDGVAKGARLIFYDAQITPSTLSCSDPAADGLSVGDLFTGPDGGDLGDGYTRGGRVASLSFGNPSTEGQYLGSASDVDTFMFTKKDALVFVSAGNDGDDADTDGQPDRGSIGNPSTCKNCVSVGASGNANDTGTGGSAASRAFFSSVGPAILDATGRIGPVLMAPGTDFGNLGNMGIDSEFSCRSNDNNQDGTVQCDTVLGVNGTSFSAPAAAGAALLVRDYFAQGYYPSGQQRDGDTQATLSGAAVKAMLIASADYMGGGNLWEGFRFNREQGYGRIEVDNLLPLATWPDSPTGLILADGGIGGGPNNTSLSGTSNPFGETYDFDVEDITQQLRIAIAWVETAGANITADIDLELTSPSGETYVGNFFSEDRYGAVGSTGYPDEPNDTLDAGENCIDGFDGLGAAGEIDEGAWSIPTSGCASAVPTSASNPSEMIALSPDPEGNSALCLAEGRCEPGGDDPDTPGVNESLDNQLEVGQWTLTVTGPAGQTYAVALAGPVALGSSVRFNAGNFVCNEQITLTVNETDPTADNDTTLAACGTDACREGVVSGRLTVQVLDSGSNVKDEETGLTLTQAAGAQRYSISNMQLTDGTARSPAATHNNGVLDIRTGETIVATYADENGGSPVADRERQNSAQINCDVSVGFGGVTWGQFGIDTSVLVDGGCETDARNLFTFGFPDRYMDEGEVVGYRMAFQSTEAIEDLDDVEVALSCILTDADSPADCKPGSNSCTDSNRTNNSPCPASYMTILDSPRTVGLLPAASGVSSNFTIAMGSSIPDGVEVEMRAAVSAKKSGKSGAGIIVSRHTLDVDVASQFFSTDYPTGGVEIWDYTNNEDAVVSGSCAQGVSCAEGNRGTVTTSLDFEDDYRFQTYVWSSLQSTGKNLNLQSPWHFDTNNGNFRVGLSVETSNNLITERTMANWGEDQNFNNFLDPGEDRDVAANGTLDNNWGTLGGCGWQTNNSGNPRGGVWHTGRIDDPDVVVACAESGAIPSQCQLYETAGSATTGGRFYFELLKTPIMEKVNGSDFTVEFIDWQWNQSIDLPDDLATLTWELDTDTTKVQPSNLDEFPVLNLGSGPIGAKAQGNAPLWDGYQLFASNFACDTGDGVTPGTIPCAQLSDCVDLGLTACVQTAGNLSINGSLGNNREGKNSCFFEGAAANANLPLHLSEPPDNDFNDGGTATIDETVSAAGPIRNMDLSEVNGFDMRFTTLEDVYGESGSSFQGAVGFLLTEGTPVIGKPLTGFGLAVDDMVVMWREFETTADTTICGGGGNPLPCAAISIEQVNIFEGSSTVGIRIVDTTPPTSNDCNQNGVIDGGETGNTDCDGDTVADIVALATTESLDQEVLILNSTGSDAFETSLAVSTAGNVAGSLFLSASGTDNPTITVRYTDVIAGQQVGGTKCPNDVDPAKEGVISASTTVFIARGTVVVAGYAVSPTNDGGCPGGVCGDNDPFADYGETLDILLTISNKSGVDLDEVVVRIATDDPKVDCVIVPFVSVGTLLEGETITLGSPFRIQIDDGYANRASATEDLSAEFLVTMATNLFDSLAREQTFTLDFNLDVSSGANPGTYSNDFEGGSVGNNDFNADEIDAGKNSLALSDGYRCQYNDPDFPNSNSYPESAECFLGFSVANDNEDNWHIGSLSGGTKQPGARAFDGSRSLHWGQHPTGDAAENTEMLKQLEGVFSDPINLGWDGVNPELSFKHQISMADYRTSNTPFGESVDRGMVAVREVGTTDWVKITPFQNIYDVQGTNAFSNCLFDPIDDGHNEDDYFDPGDPDRTLGPSSTCFPEFVFGWQGDTDYRNPFNELSVGRAEPGSAEPGATITTGTWVTTRFDLSRYAGRSIQVRFLATSIEVEDAQNFLAAGFDPDSVGDDGWYIDAMQITHTLGTAATIDIDNATLTGLACTSFGCTSVNPALSVDPAALAAPGTVTELDASASTVTGSCLDGTLQYQFWIDDGDTILGNGSDVMMRDWTDNPTITDAPGNDTDYGVKVRCSSALAVPACDGEDASQTVTVTCPSIGTVSPDFTDLIGVAADKSTVSWATTLSVDAFYGDLDAVRGTGSFAGTEDTTVANGVSTNSVSVGPTPVSGSAFYILVRSALGAEALCNEADGSWGSSARDAQIVLP